MRVSSSSQSVSLITLHPVWGISSVVVLGERNRYSSDESIIHLMPTKKVMIIDHVGLYFILTIKEQFVIWKEKMFPDRRQSWQFVVEAHSSGMRVSSRSTAPHYNPLRQSVRVDCQLASFIIKLSKYQAIRFNLRTTWQKQKSVIQHPVRTITVIPA